MVIEEDDWSFDVMITVLKGPKRVIRSRVTISRKAYPAYGLAAETAALIASVHHRGMATDISVRI